MIQSGFSVNTPSTVFERLDGEVIIISNITGKYYSLGYTASDVWYLIDNAVRRSLWLEIVMENFLEVPVSAEEELNSFVKDLLSENLIKPSDAANGGSRFLPQDYPRGKWSSPELLIFDDLQDLLLVDPIHETGDEGWPFAARD